MTQFATDGSLFENASAVSVRVNTIADCDNRGFSLAAKAYDYLFDRKNEAPSQNNCVFWDAIPDNTSGYVARRRYPKEGCSQPFLTGLAS